MISSRVSGALGENSLVARISLLLLAAWICHAPNLSHAQVGGPARFLPIDLLSGDAVAISDNGEIVALSGRVGKFLWTEAGGTETFSVPTEWRGASRSDISGDGTTLIGSVTVGRGLDARHETFRWTRAGGFQSLGRFSDDRLDRAYANGVSYDGTVIVGTNDTPEGRRAFRWTADTGQVNLGTLGRPDPGSPPFSDALDVSPDGSVIVGYVTTLQDPYYKAFRWTEAGGFDVIGVPEVTWGIPAGGAHRISADGSVITGYGQTTEPSGDWVYTPQKGFAYLNVQANNDFSSVAAISHNGAVLAGNQADLHRDDNEPPLPEAVIWLREEEGYVIRRLSDILAAQGVDTGGMHLRSIVDMSADGHVMIGEGIDDEGNRRSWYAVVPSFIPEPSGFTIAVIALLACLRGGSICGRKSRTRLG